MAKKKFRITGRVINLDGQGIFSLRIEAWDKDLIFNDLVGSATTTGIMGTPWNYGDALNLLTS